MAKRITTDELLMENLGFNTQTFSEASMFSYGESIGSALHDFCNRDVNQAKQIAKYVKKYNKNLNKMTPDEALDYIYLLLFNLKKKIKKKMNIQIVLFFLGLFFINVSFNLLGLAVNLIAIPTAILSLKHRPRPTDFRDLMRFGENAALSSDAEKKRQVILTLTEVEQILENGRYEADNDKNAEALAVALETVRELQKVIK